MKDALDTNIFIDGFRNEEAQAQVFVFLNRALPSTYLSAVVMQELAAGAFPPCGAMAGSRPGSVASIEPVFLLRTDL